MGLLFWLSQFWLGIKVCQVSSCLSICFVLGVVYLFVFGGIALDW
jgi:hypothetical protein